MKKTILTWLSAKIRINVNDLKAIIDTMDADKDGTITIAELVKEVKRWLKK